MNNETLKVKAGYRDIWKISWPIMISGLANTVINFMDIAFVSHVGETELAASAIGGVFYFVMVMLGVAIGIGSQIMIARKAGENKPLEIGNIFDHSVLLLVGAGLLMMAVTYLAAPLFITGILTSPEVAAAAVVYLKARSWGIVLMMVLVATRCLFTGIGQTRIIGYTTGLMMVINFILGYALTFGHFGLPAWGIKGVGTASAISESAAALFAVCYSMNKKSLKDFHLFRFRTLELPLFAQIFKLSAPIVLQHFLSMGSWFLFFVLIEKLGKHELAISNVVRSIYMVLMTPIWGFSQAANTMVSNIIGQKLFSGVIPLCRRIINMSFITSVITVILVVSFPGPLLSLVTTDANVMHDSIPSLLIICGATLFFSISIVLLSGVSGTGDTRAAMMIELINIAAYLLFIILCSSVFHSRVEIVWLSEVQYWILMGIFSYLYLRSRKWEKRIDLAE
ncbi:MAG: MATE family efflux transporter [Bacteroidota bacterium]